MSGFLIRPLPDEAKEEFAKRIGDAFDAMKAHAATAKTRLWTAEEFRRDQAFGNFISKGTAGIPSHHMGFLRDDPDRLALFDEFKAEVEAHRAAGLEELEDG